MSTRLRKAGWNVYTKSNRTCRAARLMDMLTGIFKDRDHYALAHIEVYSGAAFIWAELCGLLLHAIKKPFVLTLHGGELPRFAKAQRGRVLRLLGLAGAITTPSLYLKGALSGLPLCIRYVPNAIEIEHYSYRERPLTGPHLVWLRAFHAIYDPATAIRVLSLISHDFPQATLTMLGPDKQDGSLEGALRLAETLGMKEKIRVVGAIPKGEVPLWIDQGEIFVNTTLFESFGVSVVEAAAVGTPIVSTDVGELSRLWVDGHDALLVPPGDATAMVIAIKRLMEDPSLAVRLSMHARRKAERFDWSMILPQWQEIFGKIAENAA